MAFEAAYRLASHIGRGAAAAEGADEAELQRHLCAALKHFEEEHKPRVSELSRYSAYGHAHTFVHQFLYPTVGSLFSKMVCG